MRLQQRPIVCSLYSLLVLLALVAAGPGLNAQTLKNPRLTFTGSTPSTLLQGDFDGDGKPDLVYLDGSIHVLLGNGDGTFRHSQDISLPQGMGGTIIVADVNKDGRPDILVGSIGSQGQIGTLLGNGDGTFAPMLISVFDFNFSDVSGIGVADVNRDGAVDLIVTDAQHNKIFTLFGNNTGSFALFASFFNGGGAATVFTGDFNGDGNPDFIVFERAAAEATVYLGNGNGTFGNGVPYHHDPDGVTGLVLADMDGDGHPDMVVTGFTNSVTILHGNPDGTFTTAKTFSLAGSSVAIAAVADINGDGILDLVMISGNGTSILLGKGNLTYGPQAVFAAGFPQAAVVIADFNLDGHLDVATPVPGGIALLLGNGDGTLQTFDSYDLGQTVSSIVVADFNGDHVPDVAADAGVSPPRVLLGIGAGKLNVVPAAPQTGAGLGAVLFSGDFNGDGKADVLYVSAPFTVGLPGTVLFGNGDGTFSSPLNLGVIAPGLVAAAVADLNHDGRTDIIEGAGFNSQAVLRGETANTFTALTSNFPRNVTQNNSQIFADFDHDGILDTVLIGSGFSGVPSQVLLGNGDGTFRLGPEFTTNITGISPANTAAMVAADLDGDGNIDIIATMAFFPRAEIFYGHGDGTFSDPVVLELSGAFGQIVIADMNGDGKPDLVMTDGKVISVIHNNGNRSFGPEIHYLAGSIANFAVADMNGDGLPDVVVAGGNDTVSVLLSQPGGIAPNGTLSISPGSIAFGQPFTLSVALTPPTAQGTVIFSVDGNTLANVSLAAGKASFTDNNNPSLALGAHTITAQYTGDGNLTPATFVLPVTVVPFIYPTTVGLTAAPNPAVTSQTVRFVATVNSAGPTPRGMVTFHDGTVTLGSAKLDLKTAVALFDTALLSGGPHSITATYPGDANSAPSSSSPVNVTVTAFATTTGLAASPSSPQAGATVALTATVASGSGTPTGSVVFSDGNTQLGARALDSNGVAVLNTAFASRGGHSLTAAYQANAAFAGSTSSVLNLTVNDPTFLAPSSTRVTASQDADRPDRLTFTAQISSAAGTPSGQVIFFDGATQIGESTIMNGGSATLELAAILPGTRYITAVYPGGAGFGPSAASTLLNGPSTSTPDFSLRLSSPTVTLLGQTTTLQVNVGPFNGFSHEVRLSCASATAEATCSFEPASVMGGGASTLTITRMQQSSSLPIPHSPLPALVAIFALGLIFLLATGTRARRIAIPVLVALFLVLFSGCGGHQTSGPVAFNATVTATSVQPGAPVVHSVDIQVVTR